MLKSEGIVKKHQADVLGVYRMVDSYNDRPVYKQDGGENYIYYRSGIPYVLYIYSDYYIIRWPLRYA